MVDVAVVYTDNVLCINTPANENINYEIKIININIVLLTGTCISDEQTEDQQSHFPASPDSHALIKYKQCQGQILQTHMLLLNINNVKVRFSRLTCSY